MQFYDVACATVRAVLLLACGLPAHSLLAQGVPPLSQIPPGQQIEPGLSENRFDFTIGGALAAPAGAESVKIGVGSITLDGGFNPVASGTLALLPKPGSEVSLKDIYVIAATIQQAYITAGYPLVRVFVPVQKLDQKNAQITLKVISGYIGKVQTDSLDPKIRRVVARFLDPLTGKENLTAAMLERRLLLAGEVSGVHLRSALSPGTQIGETILIVNGRFQSFQAILSSDNRVSQELGREQVTLSTAFNSTLGLGERLGVTVATALNNPSLGKASPRRFGGVYLDVPIGSDGLAIGADAALSSARPRGAAAALALSSRYLHFGGRIAYPMLRRRSHALNITSSMDLNQETQDSLLLGYPVPLFQDRVTVGRLGLNGNIRTKSGFTASGEVEFSRGIDIFNARRATEASIFEPLSRMDADAVFSKLTAGMLIEANLPSTPAVGRIVIRGQTGFGHPLLRSEQFSFAAPDLISGPPSGSLVGDTAIAVRSQIEVTAKSQGIRIVPYTFAAVAHARIESPTSFELALNNTYALGLGLNAQIPLGAQAITGALEFSHVGSDDAGARGNWVTFQLAFRF